MKKDKKKETLITEDVNHHILNIITPSGIDFDKNFTNIGENMGKIYTISKYPPEADYGWLASLCNLEGTATQVEYRYTEAENLIRVFNSKINEFKGDLDLVQKSSEKQKISKAIKDLESMIKKIAIENEPVGYVNVMLHIQDTNAQNLSNRLKRVNSVAAIAGCNLLNLKYKQLQALQCMSPYGIPNREVANIGSRNMPISTFIGGFPMASSGINDSGGYYLGKTKNGKLVILNQWIRNKDRVNSNWFITGLPGVGKSSFLKAFFMKELAFGTKIIVFDPEEEYVELAQNPDMNGEIIDCAGGTNGRINPLQVRAFPKVTLADLENGEAAEDYLIVEEDETSDLALHIQNLRVFFKLYFGAENFTTGIKATLEECLIELYKEFGITWDSNINKLKNTDYPIMGDLYKFVCEKTKEELSTYKKNIFDQLKDLLYSVGEGADKYIWNGYTTLDPRSAFIVLNTSKLLELDENVKHAQFLNLTSWAWQQIAKNRTEKYLLGIDEGYLFVDPDNIDLMKFIRNMSKRARKYEGGIMFITHSVVDVLDPEVKRLGQAIIDNACYKFVMGCDGKNLEETKKLFHLTEKEENILAAKSRGQGILFAGSVRMEVTIDIREKFLEMMGKAGGR